MGKKGSNAPVLLLIFNRPELTRRLIDHLRPIQPRVIYVGADGPRPSKEGEAARCRAARAEIERIDWPCEVHHRYLDVNAGCRQAVAGAITWFFQQEEYGIILEDDCLPDPSFFRYAAELLEHYRDNPRVMHISGDNPVFFPSTIKASYAFVTMPLVWGWATWRRAWERMNLTLTGLEEFDFSTLPLRPLARRYVKEKFWDTRQGKNDSWAYAWYFSILRAGGLCILPKKNLVYNAGFGAEATHTQKENAGRQIPAGEMDFPLLHPDTLVTCPILDNELFYRAQKSRAGLLGRYVLPRRVRRFFNRLGWF